MVLQLIAKLFGGRIKSSKKRERVWKSINFLKKLFSFNKKVFFLAKNKVCVDEP